MRQGDRTDILRGGVQGRLEAELAAALRRRLPSESKLAGALRALFPLSASVRNMAGDAERHLGRWLVLAEVATRATDPTPLSEAQKKALNGAPSSRAAWSLVAWALTPNAPPPPTRPTVELVARLSDRPSADRDTTFLFRLAAARASAARPMLEGLAKNPLTDELAVRAAMHLARDHGKVELRKAIAEGAVGKRDEARGVAAAGPWDL